MPVGTTQPRKRPISATDAHGPPFRLRIKPEARGYSTTARGAYFASRVFLKPVRVRELLEKAGLAAEH
jgi:hypothetical protein